MTSSRSAADGLGVTAGPGLLHTTVRLIKAADGDAVLHLYAEGVAPGGPRPRHGTLVGRRATA